MIVVMYYVDYKIYFRKKNDEGLKFCFIYREADEVSQVYLSTFCSYIFCVCCERVYYKMES